MFKKINNKQTFNKINKVSKSAFKCRFFKILNVFLLFAMLKNKNNFFETNIIIPKINKKWNTKCLKRHEIVHLIMDISVLVVKCAFRIRFNV